MSLLASVWRQRRAISFVNVAGGSTKDVDTIIPADDDEFWTVVDASGLEVRVTSGDGYTPLSYSVDNGSGGAFSKSSRLGRVRIDAMTVPGTTNEAVLAWLYFDSTSAQGSAAVATTITAPETGFIERGVPSTWVAKAIPPRPGLDVPRITFGKGTADSGSLWLDVTDLLERRTSLFAGSRRYEEIRSLIYEVDNSSGVAQATMIDTTLTRFVEVETGTGDRKMFARLRVKAGSAATQYTAVATINTAVPLLSGTYRTITARAGFRVRDVLEV